MAGLSDLLNLSGSALRAHQNQINVYSNNIANVNTKGYSRRTAELSPVVYNELGMGVTSGDITRLYNSIGTTALLQEQSTTSYHMYQASYLSELDSLVGGSVGRLNSAMKDFSNTLQDVIAAPEDMAARIVFLQKASALASEFNIADSYIQGVAIGDNPVMGNTSDIIDEINAITEQLQVLNENITKAQSANRSVPDLLDERDILVRDLAELVDFTVTPDYEIEIGRQLVVSGDGATRNEIQWVDLDTFTVNGNSISPYIAGGKLAALVSIQDTAATMRQQVDNLSNALGSQANALFENAYNLNGQTPLSQGYSLFSGDGTGWYGAQFLAVDTTLYDPANSLNSRPELVAVAATAAPGDNTTGQAIYDLLHAPQAGLTNASISSYWLQVESILGGAIQEAEKFANTSGKVLEMLDGSMQSVSGVNLDEELINLTSAQRAYEAAARVMSTANSLLDTLINRTG